MKDDNHKRGDKNKASQPNQFQVRNRKSVFATNSFYLFVVFYKEYAFRLDCSVFSWMCRVRASDFCWENVTAQWTNQNFAINITCYGWLNMTSSFWFDANCPSNSWEAKNGSIIWVLFLWEHLSTANQRPVFLLHGHSRLKIWPKTL